MLVGAYTCRGGAGLDYCVVGERFACGARPRLHVPCTPALQPRETCRHATLCHTGSAPSTSAASLCTFRWLRAEYELHYKNKVYNPAMRSCSRAMSSEGQAGDGIERGSAPLKKRKRVSSASFFADSGSEDSDNNV